MKQVHFQTVEVRVRKDLDLDVCAEVHEEEDAVPSMQWNAPRDLIQAVGRVCRDPNAVYRVSRRNGGYIVLKPIKKDEVLQLQSGDVRHVRLTRLLHPEPRVEYNGAATLHVQRGPKPKKSHGPRIIVTPMGDGVPAWAEYANDDVQVDGKCVVEDYLMEIFEQE